MSYATALGLADGDPTAVIKGALKPAPRAKHRAALLDPDALAEFMNDLWGWAGRTFSKPLLKACLFTFQRPGEVRAMRWADIDWGRRLWMPHITKTDVAHAVPLSDQMIVLLREMEQITGEQKHHQAEKHQADYFRRLPRPRDKHRCCRQPNGGDCERNTEE